MSQSHIQQVKGNLQHRKKTYKSISFCTHVLDVHRYSNDSDDSSIYLTCIVRNDIFFKAQFLFFIKRAILIIFNF